MFFCGGGVLLLLMVDIIVKSCPDDIKNISIHPEQWQPLIFGVKHSYFPLGGLVVGRVTHDFILQNMQRVIDCGVCCINLPCRHDRTGRGRYDLLVGLRQLILVCFPELVL